MSKISELLKEKAEGLRKEAQVQLVKESALKQLISSGMKKEAAMKLINKRLG